MNATQFNRYLMLKLPSAYLCGVRVGDIEPNVVFTKVSYHWINKNPFQSIYFAVLAMAAELATGVLVLQKAKQLQIPISTLIKGVQANFVKKAVGKIVFSCNEGAVVDTFFSQAIITKEGVLFDLKVNGYDEQNDLVAEFVFTWTVKVK